MRAVFLIDAGHRPTRAPDVRRRPQTVGLDRPVAREAAETDPRGRGYFSLLFLELEECCTVSIVGYDRSEVVEPVSWTPVH